MKLHYVLLLFCGATLAAISAAVLVSHHRPAPASAADAPQAFQVKGRLRAVEKDGTLHIAHEEIPGFMPAMEMPFTLKDPALAQGLAPGDALEFELVVTKDDSWISRIKKIADDAQLAGGGSALSSSGGEGRGEEAVSATNIQAPALHPGQPVPDFTLTDQHGRPLHLRDLRGKAVVLTFIYTRCPLPNFCPLMSKNFASLQQRFTKHFPGKTQLLSISFDPQFDTPENLNRYAALYQHDDNNWLFATGTPDQVDRVTGLFGLIREPANGFINHDLRTALIGPDGKLVHIWRSNVWTPYEVERRVAEVLTPTVAVR